MAVTLKEVAQHAQISIPAASLILNGKGKTYSKDTNERVHEAARTLGYRPNLAARAARSGKFNAVGLLMSDHPCSSRISPQLLQSILETLTARDMHLTVSQVSDEKLTDLKFLPKVLQQHMVDGMLINYTHDFPEQVTELIHESMLPAIWMNTPLASDCVYPDEIHSGQLATQYLLDRGHRKITYIEFDGSEHYSRTDRRVGYETKMQDTGLHANHATFPTYYPKQVNDDPMSYQTHEQMCRWLKSLKKRPTAIVTYSPWEAQAMMYAAALCGISVPKELSIVAIGDDVFSFMGTSITSAVLPLEEMGQSAVSLLLRKIASPARKIRARKLKSTLVEAQTARAV
ncbi:MAG TPA: hypothetical protein DER01_14465 [Phycisphaerales bacterium]|nr:hypothetical protein [Phycisphaerales bacterium]|tara:strand:- start:5595 stop:6626 length:1032 start_codon:yes stop_codon:yes gene_type:complete